MPSLLLIDDHAIVREGFKRLFDAEPDLLVVGEAASTAEALQMLGRVQADIAILDLSLGTDSGLDLLLQLRRQAPALRCLVVSMHADTALVARALQCGASGYVTKACAATALVQQVRRVAAGERVLSDDLATQDGGHVPQLSEREWDVLRGLVAGDAPKAIAGRLCISDKTLYRHRANIMEKFGVHRSGDLVRVVRERGALSRL